MEIINIPDISLLEVELPAWFLEKDTSEQAEAVRAGMISDEKQLHKLAKTHADVYVACAAVEKLAAAKDDYSVIALADVALHGENESARLSAAGRLPVKGFVHAPFIQAGNLPNQGILYAVSVQADDALVRRLAARQVHKSTVTAYEAHLCKSVLNPRLYDLLYLLDPEEDRDYIDYLAKTSNGGARGKIIARYLRLECRPKPEDEEPGNDDVYYLMRNLMCRENDIEALMSAVLGIDPNLIHGLDFTPMTDHRYYEPCYSCGQLVSRMAFSRLTGWSHYEPCDSYSHMTYACGRVEGVTAEQIVVLCQRVVRGGDKLLREAAKAILKGYGEADGE